MNLFDHIVEEALQSQPALASLRVVVEKELLHHDMLREMAAIDVLQKLTFIGGTCLRACYGSQRLSEDLDFTGGTEFDRNTLVDLGVHLVSSLEAKYGLSVTVAEPVKDEGNVDTWKLKMITRPARRDLPPQRINIDICAIPSHDSKPMLLRNPYGVDMGTAALILSAESREEILADKLVAVALRKKLKNRDLWDIGWLKQQAVELPLPLIPLKIDDHGRTVEEFRDRLSERRKTLASDASLRVEFAAEMRRFLPAKIADATTERPEFWVQLTGVVTDECDRVARFLEHGLRPPPPQK